MVATWILNLPWNLINTHAGKNGIDPKLVGAFIAVESAGKSSASRYEPGWKYFLNPEQFAKSLGITTATETVHQATSWGLMQVMGSVAREQGFTEQLPKLIVPGPNLDVGCQFLKKLQGKYPTLQDLIASYNAGSPRKNADGTYVNEAYVQKVLKCHGDLF